MSTHRKSSPLPLPARRLGWVVAMLLGAGWAAGGPPTPSAETTQRVFVLYPANRLLPINIAADEAIRAAFAAGHSGHIEFYSEFLDPIRFPGKDQERRQCDYLRYKYQAQPPDLVIAGGGGALNFLVKYRADLFTDVPIVFCAVPGDHVPKSPAGAAIVGIPVADQFVSTLELALRLHPDTRQVALVSGGGRQDEFTLPQELSAFTTRVSFTSLSGLSMQELRTALSQLSDHTVVLYRTMFQDAAGRNYTPREALKEFSPVSRAPIYGIYDTYLGHGIVGGSMVTIEEIGRKVAQLGIRILAGEEPESAARSESHEAVPMFDWKQVQRWKIDEKQLPSGSVILFREPTYWEKNHWLILAAAALIALQATLITILLVQRRRRQRAEEALRESEAQATLAADVAGAGLWAVDLATHRMWVTDRTRQLYGLEPDEVTDWERRLQTIHPDDRERVRIAVEEAVRTGQPYRAELRVVQPDGTTRWIASRAGLLLGPAGKAVSLMGASIDITERKYTEEKARRHRGELAHIDRTNLLGELSGSLAHELGQPLGAVLANAETAELHLAKTTPNLGEVRAILAEIRNDSIRAGGIIHGMRAFLRRSDMEFTAVDLPMLLEELKKLAGPDASLHQTRLDCQVPASPPPIRGQQVQLQQVLLNLVLNGIQAMNDCPPVGRRVAVTVVARGQGGVEFAVTDAGTGVPAENLEEVFTPFHSTKPSGLGMGLAICRRIVTAHGGRIWIENNAGPGVTVHFTLPGGAGKLT